MRVRDAYRYRVDLETPAGVPLGAVWLSPDWALALECAHFAGVRADRLPFTLTPGPAVIGPIWDGRRGPPYVARVRVAFAREGEPFEVHLPVQVLREAVQDAVAPLVDGVRLKLGDPFVYQVLAFPAPGDASGDGESLELEALLDPTPLGYRPLAGLLAEAEPHGEWAWDPRDFPVLIHAGVLEAAIATATHAGPREAAGVLLGKLQRDPETATLYLEVTAEVPAQEALADETSFTFTARTWAAVTAALTLRGAGERIVGWHHSHPRGLWPCAGCPCPPERRGACPSRHPFFSQQDVHLHRTVFQSAFNVALLLSFQASARPRLDLFGWRWHGVAPRGFYRVATPAAARAAEPSSPPGV